MLRRCGLVIRAARVLVCLLLVASCEAQTNAPQNVQPLKTLGAKTAPITFEVFSDFQCPTCKALYEQTLRSVFEGYVGTGKVYFIHRDFPQHKYSRDAARYANAAARIGKLEAVSTALFSQQGTWAANGGIESCVASALTPAEMKKLRQTLQANGAQIDADIQSDLALGREKLRIGGTPTTIITCRGQSYTVVGLVSYPILRQFLEELLKR
jgi:protein-disulfide isomerase